MNGEKARRLRKYIYGEDLSPRNRVYTVLKSGQIVTDKYRQAYQKVKRGG